MSRRQNGVPDRPREARANRRRILVVCGARCTERDYLNALRRVQLSHVTVKVRTKAADPLRCIDYAVTESRKSDPAFDEVWCVVDVDQFDVAAAVRLASDADVELAVSNPCFEFWLLLHLVDTTRPYVSCPPANRELVRVLPGYDKTRLVFDDFAGGVDKAIERAKRLEQDGAGPHANPSSGMWRLVARIVGGQE